MNDAIKEMLLKYKCKSTVDYENALKEIIQEIALLGLWRAKFFEKAAFYGGSALRILYGLDRFSEDLDFSLLRKDKKFSLEPRYSKMIESELRSFGFSVSVEKKSKKKDSTIDSAFIKAGTLQNMVLIEAPVGIQKITHSKKITKIKLDIDTDPPLGFTTEAKYLFLPIPFSVNTLVLPDLFAGKLHAVLCRSWNVRVKGRDWYDFIWYISRNVPLNLRHLECRMRQSNDFSGNDKLSDKIVVDFLNKKINTLDFNMAKKDVEIFLKDASSLEMWSREYFLHIVKLIKFK